MKITEIWQNKEVFLKLCRENKACEDEYQRCIETKTEDELLEVVSRNFNWCVAYGIIEEWLPEVLNTKKLNCAGSPGLTELPALPKNEWLNCCYSPGLTELPALPNNRWLSCAGCPGLTELPELPRNEKLYCDERLKGV